MGNVQRLRWPLRVFGAGLLIATAAIHLDLYLTGYRTIATIGWLFLLQVIVAFALAVAVLVTPLFARSSWLPAAASAAAGAGFAIATLGGYLLTVWVGLFGFREVRTTAGIVAGIIEIAAFAVLTLLTVISFPAGATTPSAATTPPATADSRADALRRFAVPGIAGLTVVAAVVLATSVATANGGSSGPATATHAVLHTDSVNGVAVLTNSKGFTLYWFVPDTPTSSACYGTCASYWPPVYGTPSVASGVTGVTGKFGTIRRTDGTIQATYNGHPLYTYVGDTAPGQASGNNVDLNGGFWYEVHAA
jgi:predicted lipoprotein with Yx(FWY)xxD motif